MRKVGKSYYLCLLRQTKRYFIYSRQQTIKFITTNKNIPKNIYDFLNNYFDGNLGIKKYFKN